jgi:hypothetical protein
VILWSAILSWRGAAQGLASLVALLHVLILIWGVTGWLIPSRGWLIAYMIATPLIAAQWLLNRNTCLLNNLESWLKTGRWRDAADPGQGGFIAQIVRVLTGVVLTPAQVNALSYGLLALFWLLAYGHWRWLAP